MANNAYRRRYQRNKLYARRLGAEAAEHGDPIASCPYLFAHEYADMWKLGYMNYLADVINTEPTPELTL